ncbi:MAG: class I SAM-dependent methyltransferase [Candidatus Eremiobacteraeota bacterium]|nr:class I SAM-dependent methyltransferase [Candidatus Eremiobacteraeota bacterium]
MQKNKDLFAKIAQQYNSWYEDPVNRCMDRQEKAAVTDALKGTGYRANLLEVGCGTGHWTEFFLSKGFQTTGLDISDEMLRVARSKEMKSAHFIQGDAHKLPFEDETFDICAAITLLEFVDDPRKVISQMYRVTRPGGRIIMGVLNKYSIVGIRRMLKPGKTIFSDAHFFSFRELQETLSKFGRSRIMGSTFCLPWEWALPYANVIEEFGRLFVPFWGTFLVGVLFKDNR